MHTDFPIQTTPKVSNSWYGEASLYKTVQEMNKEKEEW